jgi:fibronectin type 3 domain-containing protein
MHFSLKDINNNPLGIKDRLSKDIYIHPALIPPMPWLDHDPPKQPTLKGAIPRDDGIAVGIIDNRDNDSAYYAIYRVNGKNEVDIHNPKHLLTTVRKTKLGEIYVDKTAISGETYTYVVTAVDRLHNESVASSYTTVKAK